ncbi:MAG TPA: branched-chain amino acid ABC transporter permease [Solirubrobacteraceae bacterium]|nr:branched-chain amino acid ABC transporter permease [Solirubrobacteraceae bacterium]
MSRLPRLALLAGVGVVLAALPIYLESFWLQTGLFAMGAIVAAIGLTLLVGVAGQLSLGHAFFVAIGAYGYAFLAGQDVPDGPAGLGLPPPLALLGAVALAGIAGALFSPISGRVRGIYLGLASLGLVFIGQYILQNATGITGGYEGVAVEPFRLFGFSFSNTDPDDLTILGVPYGGLERLWYVGLVLVAVAIWYGRNLVRSRPGRALAAVRDGEIAAAVMGVDVVRYKAAAFTVSSMYAGLGGVLTALAFGRIVPESFGFLLSVDFLVMIVIGGAGSVGGAAAGAIFVTALPLILNRYSGSLPLLAEPGSGGLGASEFSRFLYGAAIVAVLLFARNGLAGLAHRARRSPEVKERLA